MTKKKPGAEQGLFLVNLGLDIATRMLDVEEGEFVLVNTPEEPRVFLRIQ